MATAQEAMYIAASQVGVTEQPLRSNHAPPYTTEYGITGAWCAMFVSWVLRHAGVPVGPHPKGYAWVSEGIRWQANRTGYVLRENIQLGDVLAFEWGTTAGGYDHVGFAISKPDSAGNVRTIEGNVGDAVRILTRNIHTSGIAAVVRPEYTEAPIVVPPPSDPTPAPPPPLPVVRLGSRGDAVRKLQELVNAIDPSRRLAVDGVFGVRTQRAVLDLQRFFGLRIDGVVGPQTWAVLYYIAWQSVAKR